MMDDVVSEIIQYGETRRPLISNDERRILEVGQCLKCGAHHEHTE